VLLCCLVLLLFILGVVMISLARAANDEEIPVPPPLERDEWEDTQ